MVIEVHPPGDWSQEDFEEEIPLVRKSDCDALTDMAYYNGARDAQAALGAGMTDSQLTAEMEARVAPARKYLAEMRKRQ